ncbi:MAG: NAD-dependent epimerase/dehydratase family protein [Saprospiraceae bacterium]|nr:NAD-dependent epimerase/dehydratase family protein [Saprospiraceae bacterium]
MNKIAIIIGATGLVGNHLLHKLLLDPTFSLVKIFVRRATGVTHEKLDEKIIDFKNIELIKKEITGDVLFSCLGTTLRQAGSKAAQYEVDYTFQYQFAQFASENGVDAYLLVSSTSANSNSMLFYSKIKGKLEDEVKKLGFKRIVILQPSVLSGERKEERFGEKLGAGLINFLSSVFPFLKKYRSISGDKVASALISYYKEPGQNKIQVYKLDEIHRAGTSSSS